MKLSHSFIEYLASRIVWGLEKEGLIHLEQEDEVVRGVQAAITEDLQVEDRLNEEVREILRARSDEMNRLGVQYHDMFRMIKAEIVRKRKLIL